MDLLNWTWFSYFKQKYLTECSTWFNPYLARTFIICSFPFLYLALLHMKRIRLCATVHLDKETPDRYI